MCRHLKEGWVNKKHFVRKENNKGNPSKHHNVIAKLTNEYNEDLKNSVSSQLNPFSTCKSMWTDPDGQSSVSALLSPSPLQAGFTPLCPCVPGCCSDRWVLAFLLGAAPIETPAGQLCWHRLRSLLPSHRAFLPPLLPEHCSVLTVKPLPCRASMTKHTSGFNSSLCTGLAGPGRFLCCWQGHCLRCILSQWSIQGYIWSLLIIYKWIEKPGSVQKFKDCITRPTLISLAGCWEILPFYLKQLTLNTQLGDITAHFWNIAVGFPRPWIEMYA